jgi:tetratricopeptide (TPR) repeat protein
VGTSRHAYARRRRVITLEDRDFILGAAAWTAQTDLSTIDVGLSPDEALRRAPEFLRGLREGRLSPADARLDDASIDVLHAACRLLAEPNAGEVEDPLDSAAGLYDYIEKVTWLGPDFDERAELLAACAFAGWRIARRKATPSEIEQWTDLISVSSAGERIGKQFQPLLDDPRDLVPYLKSLRDKLEVSPQDVLSETNSLYQFVGRLQPPYSSDSFLLDEREYFLGETARIAGTACRHLSKREEVRSWLDLAEGWFLVTENATGNLSKVSYQRLALRTEERDFGEIPQLLPPLISSFEKLGMSEDVLKARFLEAEILKETGHSEDALHVYGEIVKDARNFGNEELLALAHVNLVQIFGLLGEAEEAVRNAKEAAPLLRRLGNRIALAKLHWGIGYIQRSAGDVTASIAEYRAAQDEFAKLGMRADVAAVHLLIAGLLLDADQEKQAEREIRQALPIIDEYKLVPEGFAAMTLLRNSLRRQKIDRQALRNLHEHFEQKKP